MEYIATFGSTHKALKAEQVLKRKGIAFKLIPTPKKIAAFCDLAVSFEDKDITAVETTFRDCSVKTAAIYIKKGDEYVKV